MSKQNEPFASLSWTGATRSSLIEKILTLGRDSEGLIFGTTRMVKTSKMSDHHGKTRSLLTKLNPYLFVELGEGSGSFYDGKGDVYSETLSFQTMKYCHGECKLLGWWRCRHGIPLSLSLREITICTNLLRWMNSHLKKQDLSIVCGLFGFDCVPDRSIHAWTQRFFLQMGNDQLSPMEASIPNLMKSSAQEFNEFQNIDTPVDWKMAKRPVSRAEQMLDKCMEEMDVLISKAKGISDVLMQSGAVIQAEKGRKRKLVR